MEAGHGGSESYYPVSGKARQVFSSATGGLGNCRDGSLSFMSRGSQFFLQVRSLSRDSSYGHSESLDRISQSINQSYWLRHDATSRW
jgi:hypothetical protein